MAENKVEFRYTPQDVASAQRMRFFGSRQIWVLAGIWVVSTVFLLIALRFFSPTPLLDRPLVLSLSGIYLVSIILVILVMPYLSYAFTRFWRLPLQLQFNEKQLRVSVVKGKSKGLLLTWDQISKVQENTRVLILYYGDERQFIILPKSAFGAGKDGAPSAAERRFRDLLQRKGPQRELLKDEQGDEA